jgi:hypothetical protein
MLGTPSGTFAQHAAGPQVNLQMRNDPAAAMPPIQLPPNFPNWQVPDSGHGGLQQGNGMEQARHPSSAPQVAGSGVLNGGPTTGAGNVCRPSQPFSRDAHNAMPSLLL